jgi:hypothetical protein
MAAVPDPHNSGLLFRPEWDDELRVSRGGVGQQLRFSISFLYPRT